MSASPVDRDLTGTTIVVTGASDGIGAVTARELARAGANVVLAVRNEAKAHAVSEAWVGSIEVRRLDLSSLESVREFADGWEGPVDVLVNNAGVLQAGTTRTQDGFEAHIGVNHLGHFALTQRLLPSITGRVVTVTSDLHKRGRLDVDDLNWERRTPRGLAAYNDSKLANLLFAFELQRRLEASGSTVLSLAAHPGVSTTNLAVGSGGLLGRVMRPFISLVGQDVDGGAQPTLHAATQPLAGGSYVGPGGPFELRGAPKLVTGSSRSRDKQLARALWARSVELTATDALPSETPTAPIEAGGTT
jgi:NAD(P)-dependent dehydrogenase (short-subunit alcohol dehydrogenase family)